MRIKWYATWPISDMLWPWPEVKFSTWPFEVMLYRVFIKNGQNKFSFTDKLCALGQRSFHHNVGKRLNFHGIPFISNCAPSAATHAWMPLEVSPRVLQHVRPDRPAGLGDSVPQIFVSYSCFVHFIFHVEKVDKNSIKSQLGWDRDISEVTTLGPLSQSTSPELWILSPF